MDLTILNLLSKKRDQGLLEVHPDFPSEGDGHWLNHSWFSLPTLIDTDNVKSFINSKLAEQIDLLNSKIIERLHTNFLEFLLYLHSSHVVFIKTLVFPGNGGEESVSTVTEELSRWF